MLPVLKGGPANPNTSIVDNCDIIDNLDIMPIIVNKNAEDNGHDVSNPILPDKEVKEQTSLGTNLVESKENDACTDGATVDGAITFRW